MEPQVTTENYMVTLTDDHGMYSHYKSRLEVGDFINGINWGHTRRFAVEPVEQLAEWELELLEAANSEVAQRSLQEILSDPNTPSPWSSRNRISANGTVTYKKQRVAEEMKALELSQEEVAGTEEVTEVLAASGYIEEWKVLDCLPIDSFEINFAGDIRHRRSKALMPQEFDIDHCAYRTVFKINGKSYSVFGTAVARKMWEESNAS